MEGPLTASLLEGVPMPLLLVGRDERILGANAGLRALFAPAVPGRHHALAVRNPVLLAAIAAALQDRRAAEVEIVLTGPAAEAHWQVAVTPVEGDGQAGALCAFRDITAEQAVGQMRRDFVANVSHELRTPLTALLGFIETLRGAARDDAAARERFLGIMEREAGRMNRLVRDLLSLSRVEAEERVRPTDKVDLAALATAAVAALRPMAEAAGVAVALDGAGTPAGGGAGADPVTPGVHKLVGKGVKNGGAGGGGGLRLSHLDRDPALRGPALCLEVQDWGDGIDPIHIPRLTERFYRVDSHRSREKGGTGLGLAIVKHIIARHRGRMRIDSAPGEGSTFTLLLPAG